MISKIIDNLDCFLLIIKCFEISDTVFTHDNWQRERMPFVLFTQTWYLIVEFLRKHRNVLISFDNSGFSSFECLPVYTGILFN